MSKTHLSQNLIARRAELLAELFLQELEPQFLARSSESINTGYDLLAGFPNPKGGINNIAVQIKGVERLVRPVVTIPQRQYQRWIHSNIPTLLLVVDVKENRFFFAWPPVDLVERDSGATTRQVELAEAVGGLKDTLARQLKADKLLPGV